MSTEPLPVLSFLLKDYELKIRYLSDHFTRIWVRFNFFVTMQTALSIALFGWFKDKTVFDTGALPIAIAGAVSSAFWYCFGAQDRYLVAVYREQIAIVAKQLSAALKIEQALDVLELEPIEKKFIAVGDVEAPEVKPGVSQWRCEPLSTTKLVAWFPIVVASYWIIMISEILAGGAA